MLETCWNVLSTPDAAPALRNGTPLNTVENITGDTQPCPSA